MSNCNYCGIDEDRYDRQADRIRELEATLSRVRTAFNQQLPDDVWVSLRAEIATILGSPSRDKSDP